MTETKPQAAPVESIAPRPLPTPEFLKEIRDGYENAVEMFEEELSEGHTAFVELWQSIGLLLNEIDRLIEASRFIDHDGPCYYCGEPTDSLAGNPGLWPLRFPHEDEPGKMKWHHAKCVMQKLREGAEAARLIEGAKVEEGYIVQKDGYFFGGNRNRIAWHSQPHEAWLMDEIGARYYSKKGTDGIPLAAQRLTMIRIKPTEEKEKRA